MIGIDLRPILNPANPSRLGAWIARVLSRCTSHVKQSPSSLESCKRIVATWLHLSPVLASRERAISECKSLKKKRYQFRSRQIEMLESTFCPKKKVKVSGWRIRKGPRGFPRGPSACSACFEIRSGNVHQRSSDDRSGRRRRCSIPWRWSRPGYLRSKPDRCRTHCRHRHRIPWCR